MVCLNIQGLTGHLDELKIFVDNCNPLLVCLNENHITSDIYDFELALTGYNLVRLDSSSRHTGGVCIYIKNEIKFKINKTVIIDTNLWYLEVFLKNVELNFILGCLYHSPNSSDKIFLDKFEEILYSLSDKEKKFMIMGDFNINYQDNENNCYSIRLKKIIDDFGLKQQVSKATHFVNNNGRTIDLMVSNFSSDVDVLDSPNISDHKILQVNQNFNHKLREKITRGRIDYDMLNVKLANTDWNEVFRISDIDHKVSIFYETILNYLNEIAPKKTLKVKLRNNGWFCEEIKEAIQIRDIALNRYRFTNSVNDLEQFKYYRNLVTKKLDTINQNSMKKKLMEIKTTKKKCGRHLNP